MIFDLLVAGAFALATLRRYSAAWIVTFLFILNLELNSVSGLVCKQPPPVERNTTEPWLQPCGTVLTSAATSRNQSQRHYLHQSLKKVRLKTRVANYSHICFKKERQKIYKNTVRMQRRQYKFNWLPKEQLTWYCKKILCLEKEQKPQRFLPYLYDNLQRFAITFHELQKFHLNSSVEITDIIHIRDWMMNVTFNQILQMLCEVETAMYNLQIDLPPPHNTTIITPEFWSKEGGVTQMLIQDWGVLKIYGDFVYDWTLGMNNILNATLPDTCKIRSHDKNPKRRCILKKRHLKLLRMKKSRMLKKQNLRRNSSSNRISRRKLFNLE